MIRFLGLLLIFCLGLTGAAAWHGEMHHLRRAVPEYLPGWSDMISDDARILHGQLDWPAHGQVPAMTLAWAAGAPGVDGLRWDLRLTGQGIDIKSELLLPYWPDRVVVRGSKGAVNLAALSDDAGQGLVAVQALDGEVTDLLGARRATGTLTAEAKRVAVEGEDLGSGPILGRLDADGTWQANITLTGGLSDVQGTIKGAFGAGLAQLEAAIADATALPDPLRGVLEAVGTAEGDGIRINLPIVLRN